MSWQDRTKPTIEFTSPLKKRFSAFWGEDDVEGEKSLGIKKYPNINGAFVQNMGSNAIIYPLSFFFEGPDHDLEGAAFFQTCQIENGAWEIIHPILGKKILELSTFSRKVSATDEASMSNFDTTWIEAAAREEKLSRANIPEFVAFESEEIFIAAADEFDRNIVQDTETQKQAVRTTSKSLLNRIKSGLAALYELSNEINARVNKIQSAINSTLNEFILRPLALAAQFQQLIALPALAVNDVQRRLESYRTFAESIFELTPETVFPRDKNIAACLELNAGATLAASAQSLVTGVLPTRQAAIENAEALLDMFTFVTNGLDGLEQLFKDQQADKQFFTQSETFADISSLISLAADAALKQSFDLAIEKRFSLETFRSPIDITIAEYGDPEQLDLFNSSNALQGDDLIMLPPGKEVVVYV